MKQRIYNYLGFLAHRVRLFLKKYPIIYRACKRIYQFLRGIIRALRYRDVYTKEQLEALLQKHMKLTDAEVEMYFGEIQSLLETTNTLN